jgi:predicted molibdopterin-dependent oxidoreductase YjgC
VFFETAGREITGCYPSWSHPTNEGRLCVRGWHVYEVASSPDRLKQPLIRKNDKLVPAGWDEAYDLIAKRLREIRDKHGPDAIGFLNSARSANEDGYILQKLARAVIGTNNVDHGTSIYRFNTVDVLLDMLGMAAATNSIGELSKSDVIVVNGIDLGQQLPTIGGRVIRAKLDGARLIVVDPRSSRVAEHADIFLQINPGSEPFLYGAIAKIIVDRGLMNLDFIQKSCRDYDKFLANIESFDVRLAASRCGVAVEAIQQAALIYGRAKSAAMLYSTGAEARGKESIQSIVNLALLTGNLGREGTGILPLAEHNNLQGGCDVGVSPAFLPGYRPVTDASARAEIGKLWGCNLPAKDGLDVSGMLHPNSPLKALWLDRHNPVVSATYGDARVALKKMEFVVLQNLFMTRTAELAHVVLPTAAFGEEDVTFTNTERRIQLATKVAEPPAGLTSAWQQMVRVANFMGAQWNYPSAASVMEEIGRAIPSYEGATYENLSHSYGRQWPCTKNQPLGTQFLFEKREAGRPIFKFVPVQPSTEPACASAEYPFALMFGHSLYYWHQNTLVQHSETLKREYGILLLDYPQGFVEIHPDDAKELKVRDGGKIRLVTPMGSVTTFARVTPEVKHKMIYVPYFLQQISLQLLGEPRMADRSGPRAVCVRLETA